MKRDIRELQFKSIAGWRGDSMVCPQAFGGDVFAGCSMGCWWCFCREMEQGLYNRYYNGWSRELVRPCDPEDFRRLFDSAFGSDKETNNWEIKCLRYGLPFNMGSKAEIFCAEDFEHNVVEKVLRIFLEYHVPVIFETKTHFAGIPRYLDIIRELKSAVIVSIMGGSDTLNYKLEPGSPPASSRWKFVEEMNRKGIWTGVRWEPILMGINSAEDVLEGYAEMARRTGARHVSFYNYRTSNYKLAQAEFEKRGHDYLKLLENNLDENWAPVGKKFFEILRRHGVRASSPDFVNFPFDSSCESCCGVDGLFKPYQFTYQHACQIIKERGSVCWGDMEAVPFKNPEAYARMRAGWNGGKGSGGYFSLKDSPEIKVVDQDENGFNIYAAVDSKLEHSPGIGLGLL